MHYIWEVPIYANIIWNIFGTDICRKIIFFICFCWSVNCMSQVSKFHIFFLAYSETVENFMFESF